MAKLTLLYFSNPLIRNRFKVLCHVNKQIHALKSEKSPLDNDFRIKDKCLLARTLWLSVTLSNNLACYVLNLEGINPDPSNVSRVIHIPVKMPIVQTVRLGIGLLGGGGGGGGWRCKIDLNPQ